MAERAQPPLLKGTVKSVLSADSVVIRGQPRGGPPPERILSFSEVTGPRMMRRPNSAEEEASAPRDEPFAWDCREALRRLVVGKDVTFRVFNASPGGREYGVMYVNGQSVTATLVSQGWLKIRDGAKGSGPDFEELTKLQSAAQDAKLGVWQPIASCPTAVRDVKWFLENPQSLVDQYKGKEIPAVIEQVRDATTIRLYLLPNFEYITVMLSGIRGPMLRRDPVTGKEDPEPFAAQAKYFAEVRLLQREVKVILEGVNNNNFLGTVIHPAGNISEYLLRDGYAKIVDWSMSVVTQGKDKLRAAEKHAKEQKLRVWQAYAPVQVTVPKGLQKKFTATVEEIVSPECVMVRMPHGDEQRLWLSSVRQPRRGPADGESEGGRRPSKFKAMLDTPYGLEAREFLRQKLVGKKVQFELDCVKKGSDGYPDKACVTVKVAGVNVAEAMISKGLATTVRHRQDDEQRSPYYDDLVTAETRAKKNGKGVHNPKEAPLHKVAEVTTKVQADRYLPSFQRLGRVHGVVEFVSSGSRLKVYVPKETCLVTIVLAGLSCPRSSRPNEKGDPFGDEAQALTRALCMQREVEIEVEASDRMGSLIGHVHVKGQNVAVELIEAGFAKLHFTADRYRNFSLYGAAETKAKAGEVGIWKDYVAPVEEQTKVEPTERKCEYQTVVVTDVEDTTIFWAQQVDSGPKLEEAMTALRETLATSPPVPGAFTPKTNGNCVAQFSADGQWYRAKVVRNVDSKQSEVLFVDYGNREVVPRSKIAAVPLGAPSLPPQAKQLHLAFLTPPGDYEAEALRCLQSMILGGQFQLNIEYQVGTDVFATLVDEQSKTDLGKELLLAGFATVAPRRETRFKKVLAEYTAAQDDAKAARAGMWIYGDCSADDAREFGARKV